MCTSKLLVGLALLPLACGRPSDAGPDADENESSSDEEVGMSDDSSDTSTTQGPGDDSVGSSVTGDEDGNPYPPGCTDGGPVTTARIGGANEIRISNLNLECGFEPTPSGNCSWDEFVAVLRVPELAAGTYDLADLTDAVELEVVTHWDHDQSMAGCFCVDAPDPAATFLESGTLTLGPASTAGYAYTLELTDLPPPLWGGSFLVANGCGG